MRNPSQLFSVLAVVLVLIAASHVVAAHFQTIARANDYWRD